MFSKPKTVNSAKSNQTSLEHIKKSSFQEDQINHEIKKPNFKPISQSPLSKFFPPEIKPQTIFAIIDMQPRFIASNKINLITSFKPALQKAMSSGHYILFVNYDSHITTSSYENLIDISAEKKAYERFQVIPALKDIVAEYPNKATIWKYSNSGADEILEHLKSEKIQFSKICIAGINVCACVSSTVKELSSRNDSNFLIELNSACCSCDCSSSEGICTNVTLNSLELHKNVISDRGETILKSALETKKFNDANKIISFYKKDIDKYIESQEQNKLITIKRDLLSALYYLNFTNRSKSKETTELSQTLNDLLERLQTNLDAIKANRCLIM